MTRVDARDHRTAFGGDHCGTHVRSGIGLAEEVEVTNWSLSRTCAMVK